MITLTAAAALGNPTKEGVKGSVQEKTRSKRNNGWSEVLEMELSEVVEVVRRKHVLDQCFLLLKFLLLFSSTK